MSTEVDHDQIVREATASLQAKYPDRDEAEVRAVVEEELVKLEGGTVHDYLSVLTLRAAKKRIKGDAPRA